jgi:hypothetical protein
MGYTMGIPADTPFEERLEACTIPIPESGCLAWLGPTRKGYGIYQLWNNGKPKTKTVHRESYEYFCGPIPEGMVIDHLCRVRCCVNPAHLEPVTDHENWRRGDRPKAPKKTHCPQGHPYVLGGAKVRCYICEKAARSK